MVTGFADAPAGRRPPPTQRSGPSTSWPFALFGLAITAITASAVVEARSTIGPHPALAHHLGTLATALLATGGVTCLVRFASGRARTTALAALALLGPATAWTWWTFGDGQPPDRGAAAIALSAATLLIALSAAVALLARGIQAGRWLESFAGLGLMAVAVAAGIVLRDPLAPSRVAPALLLITGGLTAVYGAMVEVEASRQRTEADLETLRRQYQADIEHTEGLLHDLRNGLLSIEAALGVSGPDTAEPLLAEAARLRQLTAATHRPRTTGGHPDATFDLIPALRALIAVRAAGGAIIHLQAPLSLAVRGDEADLLRVIDNLLANAERHARPPASVQVTADGEGGVTVTVSDAGPASLASNRRVSGSLFHRGATTHPSGSGLGLHEARRLAAANGAELVLEHTSPTRTSFALHLRAAIQPRRTRQSLRRRPGAA